MVCIDDKRNILSLTLTYKTRVYNHASSNVRECYGKANTLMLSMCNVNTIFTIFTISTRYECHYFCSSFINQSIRQLGVRLMVALHEKGLSSGNLESLYQIFPCLFSCLLFNDSFPTH